MQRHDLSFDVTEAAGLGEPAKVAVTVHLPEPSRLSERPIVCFAKPGGGYSKGYFTEDLPGPARGAQAEWHAERGWIFVSVDYLGAGSSSLHADKTMRLDFSTVAAGSQAAEQELLQRLATGDLIDGFPAVSDYTAIGIGQSLGGCMTIIQQGRYHCYDGIGVLGYSGIVTHPPVRPGTAPIVAPWIPRDSDPTAGVCTNAPAIAAAQGLTPAVRDRPWRGGFTTTTSRKTSSSATWPTFPDAMATYPLGPRRRSLAL